MITTDWCTLVYPYGCTLNSIPPAVPLIGTGKNCYPYHRPILATSNVGTGRVCVVGSSQMLNDRYMKMKENAFLLESIVDFLLEGRLIDFPMPKISDYRFMPCLSELAEGPFYCWKPLLEPLPDDITTLASMELYDCGLRYYDEVMHAFEQLGLDPSSQMSGMIKPAYRIEPFRLIPALPLPSFGSLLDPPELELVDFDDMMESSQVRLTRLANRCSESDIEQFLQEGAGIVGFNCESENPFDILDLIAHKLLFE